MAFLIFDDSSEFNSTTEEFEENSGKGILIFLHIREDLNALTGLVGTYSNLFDITNLDESMVGDFAAASFNNVGNLDAFLNGIPGNGTGLFVTQGELVVNFNEETEVFTLEYTLMTEDGVITGSHTSGFDSLTFNNVE